jgi:integrase
MATIIKRGDSWRAQVRKLGIYKTGSFPTKTQAKAWSITVEADIMAGKYSGIADKTLGDILQKYHDEESPKKRSGEHEQRRIKYLMRDSIASVKLNELNDTHFIEWRNRLLAGTETHRAIIGESVLRYLHIINPAIKIAINEWKWLKVNPLTGMAKPKRSRPRDRRPSSEELTDLIFVMGYSKDLPITNIKQQVAAAMLFAVETGCRAKDLRTMRKSSVNFEDRTASVEWDTKTGFRDIALTTEACRIIKQVAASHDKDTVFDISDTQLDANFRKYKKEAMIDGLTFHDMKHEACTRLAKYMPIQDLARNVGTRNLQTLMIYYNPTAADIAKQLP